MRIDLNSDIGEAFGAWAMGADESVLDHVTSANVACGFHAGDPLVMQRTVAAAARRGVAIGAHPSLPDLQGFGRREMRITPAEAQALVVYQIGALAAFARAAGTRLTHVKPHGALYNMAARDAVLADAIARAVADLDASLVLVGLAGSELPAAGARLGLRVAHEAFADRRYEADGRLTPRSEPGAVNDDIDAAIAQAIAIATRREATTRAGETVRIVADTLCVHGDRPDAGEFAGRLRAALVVAGVEVRALQASALP
ncbi:MAG: LamB/YcsF family protein [Xanthomonadales bacterium]|nr:LamB/YcsF family protein [Xanthomonadales bacterium]